MVRGALVIVAVLAVGLSASGCSSLPWTPRVEIRTQQVHVPVPVKRTPPAELTEPYTPEALPEFLPPTHPDATSALSPEGERRLRDILIDQQARDQAWRAWAKE